MAAVSPGRLHPAHAAFIGGLALLLTLMSAAACAQGRSSPGAGNLPSMRPSPAVLPGGIAPATPRIETVRSPTSVPAAAPNTPASPPSPATPNTSAPSPRENSRSLEAIAPGTARRDADWKEARDARFGGREQRAEAVDQLVRGNPGRIERDPQGSAVFSGEVMVLLPAERSSLPESLLARGFVVLRQADVLGRRIIVLRAPPGLTLPVAIELAQQLLPGAEIDFNHLHLEGGIANPAEQRAASAVAPASPTGPEPLPLRMGLIDEALRPAPELKTVQIITRACAGTAAPQGHGAAVATVLVRSAQRIGRQARLHAADLSCGHGAVDAIAGALAWMDSEQIPVVNISLVGPHNRVLASVVASFLSKGHLLVAAVGNDGPAAPPLYPAAYPGVVGVTAVDEQGQVLLEAGRGAHVAFAALGIAEIDAGSGRPQRWRGTSFAAPVVAAALAARLPTTDTRSAAEAVAALARSAIDLGERGRDRIYGHGLVGDAAQTLLGAR